MSDKNQIELTWLAALTCIMGVSVYLGSRTYKIPEAINVNRDVLQSVLELQKKMLDISKHKEMALVRVVESLQADHPENDSIKEAIKILDQSKEQILDAELESQDALSRYGWATQADPIPKPQIPVE